MTEQTAEAAPGFEPGRARRRFTRSIRRLRHRPRRRSTVLRDRAGEQARPVRLELYPTELRRLAPTAGIEPATSRISSEVTDLYATCKISGARKQAEAATGPKPIGRGMIEVAAPYTTSVELARTTRIELAATCSTSRPRHQLGPCAFGEVGGTGRNRTFNPRLKRPLRCQLRHDPEIGGPEIGGPARICTSVPRSSGGCPPIGRQAPSAGNPHRDNSARSSGSTP
jgi:hypothetical protein